MKLDDNQVVEGEKVLEYKVPTEEDNEVNKE